MLVWVMIAEFEKTWAVSGMSIVSKVIPRLYEWKYKMLRLLALLVQLQAPIRGDSHSRGSKSVVITAGSQAGGGSSNAINSQFLIPTL